MTTVVHHPSALHGVVDHWRPTQPLVRRLVARRSVSAFVLAKKRRREDECKTKSGGLASGRRRGWEEWTAPDDSQGSRTAG